MRNARRLGAVSPSKMGKCAVRARRLQEGGDTRAAALQIRRLGAASPSIGNSGGWPWAGTVLALVRWSADDL